MNRCLVVLSMALLLHLAGCASPWAANFVGEPGPPEAAIEPSQVQVRDVPWVRLERALANIDAQVAESDVHPSQWPPERLEEIKKELLVALQVTEDPAHVRVLGSSRFKTTDTIRPDDGSLADFAAKIGANLAIWSSRYVGQADRVISEPVTTFGWNSFYYDSWPGPGGYWGPYGGTSTTWVPIVVLADEYAWIAYFLRVDAR